MNLSHGTDIDGHLILRGERHNTKLIFIMHFNFKAQIVYVMLCGSFCIFLKQICKWETSFQEFAKRVGVSYLCGK